MKTPEIREARSSRAAGPRSPRRPRVLVVDDERDTLDLAEATLTARGFDVRLASSGEEALGLLKEPFDAVLLDVMMPRMSGLQVLASLRDIPKLAHLPVILLTARQRDRDLLEGYGHGADYYIPKPCTAGQIEYGLRLVLGLGQMAPLPEGETGSNAAG